MINFLDLRTQVLDGLAASGQFETVIGHEPKAAPPRTGVAAAIWNTNMRTASSGLNALSMLVEFQVRCYSSMLQEPQDDIDPRVMAGADALVQYLADTFTLNGRTRYIDFFGSDSEGLRVNSGYLTQDQTPFRVVDVFIPLVINDAYPLSE